MNYTIRKCIERRIKNMERERVLQRGGKESVCERGREREGGGEIGTDRSKMEREDGRKDRK
jgi:hypothetical protein